jgi:polyhydroxyalkanoate synthesis regulator phasin
MAAHSTIKQAPLGIAMVLRRSLLAWIGAVAVVQDEFETWARQLIERGELAESEGRHFIKELIKQHRSRTGEQCSASAEADSASAVPVKERLMDWCLSRIGRPTKRQTRELNARIEALEARIEALLAIRSS